ECRCEPQQARDRLAAFGFRGEDVFKTVGSLSGGERSRLKLCMLMGSEINLLILDEPTNHLDIVSREWMEDALSDYTEALLFVSHDRYFIERFATRIWAFEPGSVIDFRGSYTEYQNWRQRQTVFTDIARKQEKQKKPAPPPRPASNEKRMQRLEKEIARLEEAIAALDREAEEHATDYQKLMDLDAQKEQLNGELLEKYEQWEVLSEA
ncbi:MAG: ABC-F family ATP-binding cassette domain-containing protein, partial [Oscillospiraceae bacterium]|nr:ABC-F family ATP-binding cassette domain-containing protein [Oscillospiraceae bacterium]